MQEEERLAEPRHRLIHIHTRTYAQHRSYLGENMETDTAVVTRQMGWREEQQKALIDLVTTYH